MLLTSLHTLIFYITAVYFPLKNVDMLRPVVLGNTPINRNGQLTQRRILLRIAVG
jgi:hypothetical protein